MAMFESEHDLLEALSYHDRLVRECASGLISFQEFESKYNSFYFSRALDGHESREDERALFRKHEARIAPHRVIAEQVLNRVCSAEQAGDPLYVAAGRIGPAEAVRRLATLGAGK